MIRSFLAGILIVVGLTMGDEGVAAEQSCYEDWSIAGPIVRNQGLTSPNDVRRHVEARMPGKLIKIALCRDGGRHYYRIVLFQKTGQVRTLTVEAAKASD